MEGEVKMEKVKREKRISKAICLTLAIILWLYVSFYENPTMTKTVSDVPVTVSDEQIKNLREKNLSILSISESSVDVEVTSQRLNLSKFNKIILSASLSIDNRSITKPGKYIVPVKIVYDKNVTASYYVEDETLEIVIEPILSGAFTVEADIANENIAYKAHKLETDEVTISAPESIFNRIASVRTEAITISEDLTKTSASLLLYDKDEKVINSEQAVITPKKINIFFSFFDSKSVSVVLKTTDNKKYILPSENNIMVYGDNEQLGSINQIYTEEVNVSQYLENSEIGVKLDIPEGIKVEKENEEITIKLIPAYFK